MKNLRKTSLKFLFISFTFFVCNSDLRAQIFPTYELKVKNLTYDTINFPNDVIYFDITITHTNGHETIFEYTGGQFFFEFNPGILSGSWPPASGNDTTNYSYKILSSDFVFPFVPRSPQIFGDQANQLRLAFNVNLGLSTDITNAVDMKIVRMRLWNKTGSFNNVPLGLQWRNEYPVPRTRVFSYVGTTQADITAPETHIIEPTGNPNLDGQLMVSPIDNSTNLPSDVTLKWNNWPNIHTYKIQVATNSGFTNFIWNDSTQTDTSLILTGLTCNTTYYWRITSRDSSGKSYYPTVWKFTIGSESSDTLKVNLTTCFEGKYNIITGQHASRDSVDLYLRNSQPPYSILDSSKGIIDSILLSHTFNFPNRTPGTYFLVLKHRQSIETWSKSGGETLSNDCSLNDYDFTSSGTQAYGNNLVLKGTKYCIFTGDVNQDNVIDGSDMLMIERDFYMLVTGNAITDLNGDRIVDSSDLQIADNNAYRFASLIRPAVP